MNIALDVMEREKRQRLYSLEIMYFQLHMDLVAYKANGDVAGIEQTKKKILSCRKSYDAIAKMELKTEGGV